MEQDTKQHLGILNRQMKELFALYHNAAGKHRISSNEFWIWYALLILKGDYSQQSICEMWSLPKQTVNTIITNLVKKHYLYLETIPGTRNLKLIRPTETGKAYGEAILHHICTAEQHALDKMSAQERDTCIGLIDKYITFFKEELHEN